MRSLPLIIFFGLFAAYSSQQRVKVTILYESLCPDSMRFITQQLSPYYYHLRNYIDLEFVPFGKSKSYNDGATFTCQHGPNECAGNKVQGCALHTIWNKDLQMAFVACHMSTDDLSGYYCSNQYGIDFAPIIHCATTDLGTKIQLEHEKRTLQYRPAFVPTIIFNDIFDQKMQDKAFNNFLGTVCEIINYSAPVCSGTHY